MESMTNEKEPNLEARVDEEDRNIVNYHPISPKGKYNRKPFVSAQKQLNDLGAYAQALSKDVYNVGAREDLCGLLLGDSNKQNGMAPERLIKMAGEAYGDGIDSMGRYVRHNFKDFMGKLDGESLNRVVYSVQLYATGNKEHDEIVSLFRDIREMGSKDEQTKSEAINRAINHLLKTDNMPRWAKVLISADKQFLGEIVIPRFYAGRNKALAEHLQKDGKPDKDKLRKLVEDSIKVANDRYGDVPSGKEHNGERKDIWEGDLRPYYIATAQALYPIEKKELEKNNDRKQDEKKREAERQSLGMPA
jgi:hypothetical protein